MNRQLRTAVATPGCRVKWKRAWASRAEACNQGPREQGAQEQAMRVLASAAVGAEFVGGRVTGVRADTLKVAVIENLSGAGSTTNREFALATRYWAEQVKASGGIKGGPIEYIEYDSQGSTATAAEKFRSAAADGAHIIAKLCASGIAGHATEHVPKSNL